MWLGAAQKRPFNPNRFHGNWRWFYDFGTGDLGNDGVHRLDMAVAVLAAACEVQKDEPLGLPTSEKQCGTGNDGRREPHPDELTRQDRHATSGEEAPDAHR